MQQLSVGATLGVHMNTLVTILITQVSLFLVRRVCAEMLLTWFVMTSSSMIHPGLAVDCWLTMLNTSPTSF